MAYEKIDVERIGPIAKLRFMRPDVLNAFDNQMMQETMEALGDLGRDDTCRAIVVHGEGRAFSAGFDLKASAERDMSSVDKVERQMQLQFDFIMSFWSAPQPVIAATHGFCLAGAFEVALACDMTIAEEGTRFGEPEVRFGTGIVAMLLPWIASSKHVRQMLLTGDDKVDAQRALEMGIVNEVVPPGSGVDRAIEVARMVSTAAGPAVRYTKQAINRVYETMGIWQALRSGLDIDVILNSAGSEEKTEFARIRKEQGLKAAIAWRDSRFDDAF